MPVKGILRYLYIKTPLLLLKLVFNRYEYIILMYRLALIPYAVFGTKIALCIQSLATSSINS